MEWTTVLTEGKCNEGLLPRNIRGTPKIQPEEKKHPDF